MRELADLLPDGVARDFRDDLKRMKTAALSGALGLEVKFFYGRIVKAVFRREVQPRRKPGRPADR